MITEQRGAESLSNTTVLSAEPIPDSIASGRWPGVSRCGPYCGLLLTPRNLPARIRQCPAGMRPQEVPYQGKPGLAWNVGQRAEHAKNTRARLRAHRDARRRL